MAFRVILARVTGTTTEHSVLNGALAVAKPFAAHIDALFVRPDPWTSMAIQDESFGAGYEPLIKALEREGVENAAKARRQFEKWVTENDIAAPDVLEESNRPTAQWREAVGNERLFLERAAHLSDVIVMSRPADRIEDRIDPVLQLALAGLGRPVMLVPPVTHPDLSMSKILVAWNDSAEATRAVSAALPLLQAAAEVVVATAPDRSLTASAAEDLAHYLRRHSVRASVYRDRSRSNSAENYILGAAKKTKAGLIVMGAYTHNRLKEMVFGGVTRHMLGHAPIPVFLTH
jgi:nucleotide-binding universal stress UspA family protein